MHQKVFSHIYKQENLTLQWLAVICQIKPHFMMKLFDRERLLTLFEQYH